MYPLFGSPNLTVSYHQIPRSYRHFLIFVRPPAQLAFRARAVAAGGGISVYISPDAPHTPSCNIGLWYTSVLDKLFTVQLTHSQETDLTRPRPIRSEVTQAVVVATFGAGLSSEHLHPHHRSAGRCSSHGGCNRSPDWAPAATHSVGTGFDLAPYTR